MSDTSRLLPLTCRLDRVASLVAAAAGEAIPTSAPNIMIGASIAAITRCFFMDFLASEVDLKRFDFQFIGK
jgi:hypothetical protein